MSERLDEIAARLAAATPGPWVDGGRGCVETVPEFDLDRFDIMPETIARCELQYEDAALIANAPADIAWLLAELKKSAK